MPSDQFVTVPISFEWQLLRRIDSAARDASDSRDGLVAKIIGEWLAGQSYPEPKEIKQSEQQKRVGAILELWEGFPPEVERPSAGLVARWLRMWGSPLYLGSALHELRQRGYFNKGPRYLTSCLHSALINKGRQPERQRSSRPPTNAEDWK